MKDKNIYIIAGPNGAGKTTFAVKFLPDYVKCPNFVNADLIALGLAPFSPNTAAIKAGKLVLQQIDNFANQGVEFAFETTLSGKTYLRLLKELKLKGYKLHLFFLWVPDKRLALARIKDRVAEGGHNIPANDARRRFVRSIYNFLSVYRPIFDSWMLFDNSGTAPRLIAEEKDGKLYVADKKMFDIITRSVEAI
ncbi:MAG: zeta toxin family protein [Candidatus Omnitrophica bacterium]|nr:zeta toxin family protein [Candidatus Omnitrophota bacterium]